LIIVPTLPLAMIPRDRRVILAIQAPLLGLRAPRGERVHLDADSV
jgi:hypothetical protein